MCSSHLLLLGKLGEEFAKGKDEVMKGKGFQLKKKLSIPELESFWV